MKRRQRLVPRYWHTLQENAYLPEVHAIIRREIFSGTIRVTPAPRGGIRIIPKDGCVVEEPELTPRALHEHGQPTRREPAPQIERIMS
jgi:hypothetical protein